MKIRVDFTQKGQVVMVGEVGSGKAVKKFTAKAKLGESRKESFAACYETLAAKKQAYFQNL